MMERSIISQVLLVLALCGGSVTDAQAVDATTNDFLFPSPTPPRAPPIVPISLLPTRPFGTITATPTTTGRLPLRPESFTPCFETTVTNSITWDVVTTTFANATIIPHITPYANGTNITSYETIIPQAAPTEILSTTMFNGSICVAPTPCVEHLYRGCQEAQRRLFRRQQATGSAPGTSFPVITDPETYITATSIIKSPYTAPPKIEPRVDPTFTKGTENKDDKPKPSPTAPAPNPKPTSPEGPSKRPDDNNDPPPPSPTQGQSEPSRKPLPPVVSSILDGFFPPAKSDKPSQGQASNRPGPQDTPTPPQGGPTPPVVPTRVPVPSPPAQLPDGFSVLPSGPAIVIPGSRTLEPGSVTKVSKVVISEGPGTSTTIFDVQVSLGSSGDFVAIGESKTIPLVPAPTDAPELPSGFFVLPSGSGVVLPNSETLEPGSATKVDGVPISLSPSDGFIVVEGTKTIPLTSAPTATQDIVLPNGDTLEPGVRTTILGVPVSLSPGDTEVVIGSSTVTLASTVSGDVGSYIWSGISAHSATRTTSRSISKATSSTSSSEEVKSTTTTSAESTESSETSSPSPSAPGAGAASKMTGHGPSMAILIGIMQLFAFW